LPRGAGSGAVSTLPFQSIEPRRLYRQFHLRIAEATGNGALVHIARLLWDERMGELFKRLEDHCDSPPLWQSALSEHRVVARSISAHDADAARASMQRHLDQAYKRFSKGWNARH
jgi:DNA-binding FadR family transcriptional regulator